jgi:hypothetical protein
MDGMLGLCIKFIKYSSKCFSIKFIEYSSKYSYSPHNADPYSSCPRCPVLPVRHVG